MPESTEATEPPEDRPDLAAMVGLFGRGLAAAELPVLRAHGLSMWAYVVLLRLDERPIGTQTALARAIGADKTRIIGTLDDLERRGLIRREPDPADRRARLLSVTDAGHALRVSAQAGIRRGEARLLELVPEDDRAVFLRTLRTLAALPTERIAETTAGEPPTAGDAANG